MAGLKRIHYLLISVFSKLKNDRAPWQGNQAQHKVFSWAGGEARLCSLHRLSWQVLAIFLLQINLPASARSGKPGETQPPTTPGGCQRSWQAVAPGSDPAGWCFPLITSDISPALLLQDTECLIFHADTLIDWFFLLFLMKVNPRAVGLGHFQVLQPGISTERADNANGSSKGFFHYPSDLFILSR